jgi:hypothetical protein
MVFSDRKRSTVYNSKNMKYITKYNNYNSQRRSKVAYNHSLTIPYVQTTSLTRTTKDLGQLKSKALYLARAK